MSIKLITKSLLALTVAFSMASCADNDVYNPNRAQGTSSLKVPANFDWTTTRTVTCGISSPVNTQVAIYSQKECKDNQLLAEVYVSKEKATEVSLDLPTSCDAYYIQYPAANGTETLKVELASTRAVDYSAVLPETAREVDYPNPGISLHYFPAKNAYGTVMFEDLFPEKGDYDFNDFVVGYNTCVLSTNGSDGQVNDGITIELQIRAIGGQKPYQFGFEITPLHSDIAKENMEITANGDISIKLISDGDAPATFIVTNTNQLKDGLFYNTEELSTTAMPTVTLKIERYNLNAPVDIMQQFNGLISPYAVNFFLQNSNTKEEIHLKGYDVTKYATNDITKFSTEDNFVWGMKIPALIPHAIEKVDFTEAYPDFAGWVQSSGTNNTEWYKNFNADKVIDPK